MAFLRIRVFLAMTALAISIAEPAASDILFMKNGSIHLGAVLLSEPGALIISDRGEKKTILTSDIRWYVQDDSLLMGSPISIELVDGSVLKGTVSDYEEEIGVFLDISIGTILIPNDVIAQVFDLAQRNLYEGPAVVMAIGASGYLPVLPDPPVSGVSFGLGGGALWSIRPIRGLYLGFDASCSFPDFWVSADTNDLIMALHPSMSFRFLDPRMRKDFFRVFTPFVALGAGPSFFIGYRTGDPLSGDLAFSMSATIGADISAANGIGLRIQFRADAALFDDSPYLSLSLGALVAYER